VADGYDFLRRETADSTRLVEEEEMVTEAEDSIEASATANPIPISAVLVNFIFCNCEVVNKKAYRKFLR